jgi:hypothetical protein
MCVMKYKAIIHLVYPDNLCLTVDNKIFVSFVPFVPFVIKAAS